MYVNLSLGTIDHSNKMLLVQIYNVTTTTFAASYENKIISAMFIIHLLP